MESAENFKHKCEYICKYIDYLHIDETEAEIKNAVQFSCPYKRSSHEAWQVIKDIAPYEHVPSIYCPNDVKRSELGIPICCTVKSLT